MIVMPMARMSTWDIEGTGKVRMRVRYMDDRLFRVPGSRTSHEPFYSGDQAHTLEYLPPPLLSPILIHNLRDQNQTTCK
jgi:hypothetical protein